MDIKDAAEQTMSKEADLNSKVESAVKRALEEKGDCNSSLYQIPEDSDCLKDISEVADAVTKYIMNTFSKFESDSAEARSSIAGCTEAIAMLEKYRSTRLNVELAGKFKYETLPTLPTLPLPPKQPM